MSLLKSIQLIDDFVGLFLDVEMTWSNGLGHIDTFNTEGGLRAGTQTNSQHTAQPCRTTMQQLKDSTTVNLQFNHPGTTFGDFSDLLTTMKKLTS